MIAFLLFAAAVLAMTALVFKIGMVAGALPEFDDGLLPPCWAPE